MVERNKNHSEKNPRNSTCGVNLIEVQGEDFTYIPSKKNGMTPFQMLSFFARGLIIYSNPFGNLVPLAGS